MKNIRIFSVLGLIGAITYPIFILAASTQFPGYSHISEYISNLGAVGQPSALIMNIGFIVTGILIILFGFSTINHFKKDWKGLLGSLFIIFEGFSDISSGIFSCEPGCNATNPTMSEMIHNSLGPVAYPLFALGIFLWAFRFRKQENWNSFWKYTLVFAITGIIFLVLFIMTIDTPTVGLWQRLLTANMYLWMAIFSYKLWAKWELGPFIRSM